MSRVSQAVHRLRYFATDAWDEWRHSPGVNLLAVATLASTLFLAGLVMLVIVNVEHRVRLLHDDVSVQVYLRDDISESRRRELEAAAGALGGVSRVEYVSKQEARRRYKEWAVDMAVLLNELDENPLPASLEVFLRPGPGSEELGAAVVVRMTGLDIMQTVSAGRGVTYSVSAAYTSPFPFTGGGFDEVVLDFTGRDTHDDGVVVDTAFRRD